VGSQPQAGVRHEPRIRVLGYRAVQLLAYVRLCLEADGIAPSYEMIRKELDLPSREKVRRIVEPLERRGLLSRVGVGKVRRIRLQGD
jgi:hypothetical protein